MKGLVLSGGLGTRLMPLTRRFPKQLLPVADKPVIAYVMEALSQTFVTDIGMDATKAATEIGWRASVDFEEGIRRTVRWYIEHWLWWENAAPAMHLRTP